MDALQLGYGAVQLGTRFIATQECRAHADYKTAIVDAAAEDIVLTTRISGVPVSVIKTPYIERVGTQTGWVARKLLKHRKAKHWMRTYYAVKNVQLKKRAFAGSTTKTLPGGQSVDGIERVELRGTSLSASLRRRAQALAR